MRVQLQDLNSFISDPFIVLEGIAEGVGQLVPDDNHIWIADNCKCNRSQPMKQPNFSDFLVRVGGLGTAFAVSILMTTTFFPGYENYVIFAIGSVVLCCTSIRWYQRDKRKKKRT
ncbi:MAG: hypothetical protein WAW41_11190, partial [Methylobacter sp.]